MPPHKAATVAPEAGPLNRMTAIAARAEPDARAKMVSVIQRITEEPEIGGNMSPNPINHSFIGCRQNGEAGGDGPAGFNLKEEMTQHLNFLAPILVIVIIKVKIIVKKLSVAHDMSGLGST